MGRFLSKDLRHMDLGPYGEEAPLLTPDHLEQWLLHEDEDVLVFNKSGWMVCHPSKNGPWSSLVGAVREWRGLDKVHLVSRLDRETSGIVVLAKHHAAASRLQTAFAKRNTRKRYLALLVGRFEGEHRTESNLEPDPESPVFVKQRVSFGGRGKPAVTHFRALQHWQDWTLAEVIPESGRKHQIRAHAAWLGYPVAGDKIYGGDATLYLEFIETGWTPRLASALRIPRQALHAAELEIWGEGFRVAYQAPCPFEAEGFCQLSLDSPNP
jgi:23S rRNA pseudouridine1911/1915/1917 synthase